MAAPSGSTARAILVGVLAVPVFLPLFGIDWFESHEAASYPARVVEVRRCWEDGMLSARWFPDLAGGRGYPFLSFYAPLSFWLAGAFHGLGLSVPAAWKVVVALTALLGASGAYRLARLGLSPPASFAASALFVWAPYPLRDLWTRGDLAEYLALGFLPWALFATVRIARRPGRRAAAWAGLAGAAAILSHNILGMLTGLTMAGAAVLVLSHGRSPRLRRLAAVTAGGAFALLLSAFFWVPALAEKKWVQLETRQQGFFDVFRNFVTTGDLIGVGAPAREFVAGRAEPMSFEMGIALFLALLAPVAWWKGDAATRRIVALGAGLLAAGVFFSTAASSFIYERVELLRFVSLPWRFLSLAALGAALLAGAGVGALPGLRRGWGGWVAAVAVAVAGAWTAAGLARPLAELELTPPMLDPAAYRGANFTASAADEYVPIWVRAAESIPFRNDVASTGPARFSELERGVARWRFVVEPEGDVTVVLRDFFYPGWKGTLDDRPVEIVPRPGSGHAQFTCPAGRHVFEARLESTGVRKAAAWISAGALAALLVALRRGRPTPRAS